ncbi:MAG TPA: PaaI family thioesterase [Terriglobales bacterium]|nr:PaaI family thioesterase [Terriglobales bacterium]
MPRTDTLEKRLATIPIFTTLRLRLGAVSDGAATLSAPYDSSYDGVFKSFHGGLLMTLADTAACVAVLTLAGADAEITTIDMNIRFLAPCRSDCTAEATLIKFGKTLCPVSVELRDASGVHVAVAQVTYMRLGKPALQSPTS